MRSKDIDNLENILLDLEDVENGAMISLSQGEINSLESILETLKESISKDKIREKIKERSQKYFDIHDGKHSINEICFESTKVEGAVEVLKELLKEN